MISVIIPTFERFELCCSAINSAKTQTYKNIEIIVINDSSEDKRYDSLKDDENIRYFKLPVRTGLPAIVRNIGIRESRGEWIAFLDDDDIWLPNKLEMQSKFFDTYNFICSEAFYENRLYARGQFISVWSEFNPNNLFNFNAELISRHNFIINSSVVIKKSLLELINYVDENPNFRGTEDYQTWLKALKLGHDCLFVDTPLLHYGLGTYKYWNDDYKPIVNTTR
jgi:teichuronic acid biosynthesis glycosyltransferase TuaG